VLSSAAAPMMGLEWTTGLFIAVGAMLGDLFSSFLKRRMQIRTSGRAVGLDQLPEAVFPLLICMLFVPISLLDVVVMTAIFFLAEILFSKLLFRLHIRDQPY
jgi:CDP-2,3-bis-(O-geranylgeranyl)-sn-glycerol synthase